MELGAGIRWILLPMILLVGGCCDKATLERCREETAQRRQLVDQQTIVASNGPMRFDVKSAPDVVVGVEPVRVACVDGKGGQAEVRISWEITRVGLVGVRARVGAGGKADKVWVESGPKGEGVTGPWLGDGALVRLSDPFDDSILAEISVVGLACSEGSAQ